MAHVLSDWGELPSLIHSVITKESEKGTEPKFFRYRRITAERQRFRAQGAFFALDSDSDGPDECGTFIVVLYDSANSGAVHKYKNESGKTVSAELKVNVGISDGMPSRTAHAESINDALVALTTKHFEALSKPLAVSNDLLDRLYARNKELEKEVEKREPSALSEVMRELGPTAIKDLFQLGLGVLKLRSDVPALQLEEIKELKKQVDHLTKLLKSKQTQQQ